MVLVIGDCDIEMPVIVEVATDGDDSLGISGQFWTFAKVARSITEHQIGPARIADGNEIEVMV